MKKKTNKQEEEAPTSRHEMCANLLTHLEADIRSARLTHMECLGVIKLLEVNIVKDAERVQLELQAQEEFNYVG